MAKRTRPEDEAWGDYAGQLAANLKRLRLERGLSQEDVAYRSGLTAAQRVSRSVMAL